MTVPTAEDLWRWLQGTTLEWPLWDAGLLKRNTGSSATLAGAQVATPPPWQARPSPSTPLFSRLGTPRHWRAAVCKAPHVESALDSWKLEKTLSGAWAYPAHPGSGAQPCGGPQSLRGCRSLAGGNWGSPNTSQAPHPVPTGPRLQGCSTQNSEKKQGSRSRTLLEGLQQCVGQRGAPAQSRHAFRPPMESP